MFKRLVVAVFLVAVILSVSSSAHAQPTAAITPSGPVVVTTIYYSDATLTVEVGYRFRDQCSGDFEVGGIQTPYYTQTRTACTPY
jgi:opacity protein-like surface antigen